jgi:large repetitive protein
LIEPLSVNLPDLQVGEEYTGELSITNYGLVRADHVVFTPPSSDQYYRYDFLGTVPAQLEAKSRISVPYRISALQLLPQLAASLQSRALRVLSFGAAAMPAKDGSCSSYGQRATLTYDYTCANGDSRAGGAGAGFSKLVGTTCAGSNGGGGGGGGIFDPGGFGGPGGGPSPIPLPPACTPDCPTCGPGSSPGGGGPTSGGGGGGGGGAPVSPQ